MQKRNIGSGRSAEQRRIYNRLLHQRAEDASQQPGKLELIT
jgi:hypothetical protein